MELKNLLIESKEIDTRDQTPLFVYRFSETVDRKVFAMIKDTLKQKKCYYSGFKKGFICKEQLSLEDIKLNDSLKNDTVINNNSNNKIVYYKTLMEYISIDDLKKYVDVYIKENEGVLNQFTRWGDSYEEAYIKYKNITLQEIDTHFKKGVDSYSNTLRYIREAIIWKSLNKDKKDFRANADEFYYMAIWDKLPTIKGLKLTDKTYTAVWGYDQTNVDIAYLLNKKFNGLYVFIFGRNILFTRLKDNTFNDGVRYFREDNNPFETFKRDASVTGQYR